MDVRMPDGTIIQNVPEGTSKRDLQRKLAKAQLIAAKPSEYDPESPQYKKRFGPQGTGMQNFAAGAGKATVDLGRGVKQLGLGAADLVNPREQNLSDLVTGRPRSRYQEYGQKIDQIREQDAPLMNTGAGLAGNIAGTIAATAVPVGALGAAARGAGMARTGAALGQFVLPTSLKSALAGGAALGALQPTGENDSRLLNAGLGAAGSAAGYGLSKGISRLVKPVQSVPSLAQQKSAARLSAAGVPLDAAQQTGSNRLGMVKRMLGDNPLTSGGQTAQFERTAQAFDRAALKTIGETADVADESVMSKAASRIGGVMDDIAKRNPVKLDNQLLGDMATIAQTSARELETPQAAVISAQVDEILRKESGGVIDGKAYKSIREALGRLQGSSISGVKHWAGQLKNSLDDALERSAPQADSAALKVARNQWRNMESIAKVIGSQEGQHISPAKLANSLNTKGYGGKVAMTRGKGATDLMKLAKAGSTILPDRFPQSGTAPRAALQLLLPGAIGAGYGYAKEGDLSGAAKYAAGGVLAPLALQKLLNTPGGAKYLSQGALSFTSPAVQRIAGPAAQQIGSIFGPALRLAPAGVLLEAAK